MENGSYQFKGNEVGSDDEENAGIVRRYHEQRQRPPSGGTGSSRNGYIVSRNDSSKYTKPPITQSTLSSGDSVDGYDSFENTNNKKKRKIPALGGHHSTLSAEMASMGLSSTRDIDVSQVDQDGGVGHYYGTGSSATPAKSSGTGISGAGRGRYGRAGGRRHSGRSPLGVSSNGLNYSPRRDYAGPGLTRKGIRTQSRFCFFDLTIQQTLPLRGLRIKASSLQRSQMQPLPQPLRLMARRT